MSSRGVGQLMGAARNRIRARAAERKLFVALLAFVETGTNK